MKSWFSKTISLALIFAMLIQLMPMSVLAAEIQPDAEQIYEDTFITTPDDLTDAEPVREEFTAEDVLWEDISLREDNIKHFRMSDGSYIAVDYGYAVHYKDENGDYQEIDNRLFVPVVEDGGELEVAAADAVNTDRIETSNRPGWVSLAGIAADDAALITIGSGDNAVSMTPYAKLSSGPIEEEEMEKIETPTEDGEAAEPEEEAAPEEEITTPEEVT